MKRFLTGEPRSQASHKNTLTFKNIKKNPFLNIKASFPASSNPLDKYPITFVRNRFFHMHFHFSRLHLIIKYILKYCVEIASLNSFFKTPFKDSPLSAWRYLLKEFFSNYALRISSSNTAFNSVEAVEKPL